MINKICFLLLLVLTVNTNHIFGLDEELAQRIVELKKINRAQLSIKEYGLIAEEIVNHRPCSVLVFGVGKDSSLWIDTNKDGETVFLEDNLKWLNHLLLSIQGIYAYKVSYDTLRTQWKYFLEPENESLLLLPLPTEIREKRWDIIFVDAPAGMSDKTPGRMKSIYTAAHLAHKYGNTHVFVHDCNRIVEAVYTSKFLKDENLIEFVDKLRHYYIP